MSSKDPGQRASHSASHHSRLSAKDLKRPGIQRALEVLEVLQRGDAKALVVAKLDRLSRSMIDFTGLMNRATRENWALVRVQLVRPTAESDRDLSGGRVAHDE
jgi:DNA invertase Pin-like site-specific DNA recombinase